MAEDENPITVFEIEDGGTHWVAATTHHQAVVLLAESLCENMAEYLTECCDGDYPKVEVYMEPTLRVNVTDDGGDLLKEFPRGSSLFIEIPRSAFHLLKPGLVCTTEY